MLVYRRLYMYIYIYIYHICVCIQYIFIGATMFSPWNIIYPHNSTYICWINGKPATTSDYLMLVMSYRASVLLQYVGKQQLNDSIPDIHTQEINLSHVPVAQRARTWGCPWSHRSPPRRWLSGTCSSKSWQTQGQYIEIPGEMTGYIERYKA